MSVNFLVKSVPPPRAPTPTPSLYLRPGRIGHEASGVAAGFQAAAQPAVAVSTGFLVPVAPAPASSWFVVDSAGDIVADEEGNLVVWLIADPSIFVWSGRLS